MSAARSSSSANNSGPNLPDMQALDEALRDVIAAARSQQTQALPEPEPMEDFDDANELSESMDVVMRAAKTIDQLIERNRAVTDAAVRSVEHFRKEASEARAEADALRAEMQALREEVEAVKAAALVHADELEAELAFRNQELATARAWIANIRGHIEDLLGNAQAHLDQATRDDFLSKE